MTSRPTAGVVTDPPPGAAHALGTLWIAVTEAGGAVDFVPGWPEHEIRAQAEELIAAVRAGRSRMIVVGDPSDPDGTVFVTPGTGITAHRGEVGRLMVRPDLQGHGLGTVLLDAAVAEGTAMGLEQLTLGARGGTSLPEFYRSRGWELTGVLPNGVRLSAGDARDVHLFHRALVRPGP
ncbi:GNAT family N-acetyltransferase [Pseudonocardia endophytica]|uniref:Acetyltransferase (GNAT) family protein n=1 Tax=Pseudonocardia endophytica TaxID=401976 RepID=A0A4V2PHJ9_PSEEN|nr:GNAT family N-acetyltransferase [Pseudonocardia endophytica]TCK21036.1 acetyltransferase (GNAT) family protein [Pseudonocardia endophytica]